MKPKILLSSILIISALFLAGPGLAEEVTQDAAQDAAQDVTPEAAQETGQGKGLLQGLMDVLGSAAKESLQEQVDEWSGTYEGRLGEVSLVERRGNAVVLDVTYEKVKKSDGVYVQGEVLSGGVPVDGFSNALTQVSSRRGRVRLTISREDAVQDDWGLSSGETSSVSTDQIRLFLVRESHPDRPFGSIVYDLPKVWTSSNEPDVVDEPQEEEESIELAEGESVETPSEVDTATPPVRIGAILTPVQVKPIVSAQATTVKPAVSGQVSDSSTQPAANAPAASTMLAQAASIGLTSYDFYAEAGKASWRSGAGSLPFPGRTNDNRGFVRQVAKGSLHTGNAAIEMLQTHPQWTKGGWIAGLYRDLVPASNVRFKSVVGFLKGAGASDGATFTVLVYEKGRYYRVFRERVTPDRYVNVDVDLNRWAGQKIALVLRVDAGATSTRDWAVWVKPRLAR
jgi:hypothetical protein